MKAAAIRLGMLPFETSVALLLLISGAAQLGQWGVSDRTLDPLPPWEAYGISILAIFTGMLVILGVMTGLRRIELAGMLFMISMFAVRLLLYAAYLGVGENFAVTGVFYTTVLWAAITRAYSLLKGSSLVWVRSDNDFHI